MTTISDNHRLRARQVQRFFDKWDTLFHQCPSNAITGPHVHDHVHDDLPIGVPPSFKLIDADTLERCKLICPDVGLTVGPEEIWPSRWDEYSAAAKTSMRNTLRSLGSVCLDESEEPKNEGSSTANLRHAPEGRLRFQQSLACETYLHENQTHEDIPQRLNPDQYSQAMARLNWLHAVGVEIFSLAGKIDGLWNENIDGLSAQEAAEYFSKLFELTNNLNDDYDDLRMWFEEVMKTLVSD